MKALVTGASGFTGGHLCQRLTQEGYRTRALVRDPTRCSDLQRQGIEIAVGDLRDRRSLEQALKGVEVVYHIGALFRPENVFRKDMWQTNVQGTKNLLESAIGAGVQRFVHCSTIGVHGGIKNPPANEETPYGPGDHYQDSKTEAERLVLKYMVEDRIPGVVIRPGSIYGPRDLRFLKLFKSIKNRWFMMLGSGQVNFHMVYIDDLIDGMLLCGTKANSLGRVYILAGEAPVTLNQLVQFIAEAIGVTPPQLRFPVAPVYVAGFLCELVCKPLGINPPLYRRRVDFFRKNRSFDISKARRELGFQPKIDVRTGIGLLAEWYRKEGLL